MTQELREALVELRDRRLLETYAKGKMDIADDLVFGNHEHRPFESGNVVKRHFEPLLERAGLRRIRFHDTRHTYGSLLLERGAPLKYVSEQIGHSSLLVTAEVYCHKLPGVSVRMWCVFQRRCRKRRQRPTGERV
jgi:integrase